MTYRNRIVGHGDENVEEILFNPLNWRVHPKRQQDALDGVLSRVGWVQDVIINRTTGRLVDGHLRVQLAGRKGEKTVPVVYVELTEEEEKLVLATLDPLSEMAGTDKEQLSDILRGMEYDDKRISDMLEQLGRRTGGLLDEKYVRSVTAPIYEPTGERPYLSALFDCAKADSLVKRIDKAKIPEDVKEFLRRAAQRHVVFNYRNIAEYYAHADKDVQELFEESALVIIDFGKAIEMGYVQLADDIAEQFVRDYE